MCGLKSSLLLSLCQILSYNPTNAPAVSDAGSALFTVLLRCWVARWWLALYESNSSFSIKLIIAPLMYHARINSTLLQLHEFTFFNR